MSDNLYQVTITFHAESLEFADDIAYALWQVNVDWYETHRASLSDAKEAMSDE